MISSPTGGTSARSGLTLLEVLISMAIFMGAMAAISQIASQGMQVSTQAQWESEAVLRAESQMNSVICGAAPMQTGTGTFEDDAKWQWNLAANTDSLHPDLLRLEMQLSHLDAAGHPNYVFVLVRSVRNPSVYTSATTTGATLPSGLTP